MIKNDASIIIKNAIKRVLPDTAVKEALESEAFKAFADGEGKLILIAVGKAAWKMAETAVSILGDRISEGLVVTKYGHVVHELKNVQCIEAGHPAPDENSVLGAETALKLVSGLKPEDRVLFLLSGGGSALFEKPAVSLKELQSITAQLLACGADINEINTVRKHLSLVKGGRFAEKCEPAKVFSCILSDVLGDAVDTIASGPTVEDSSTCDEALAIVKKYGLTILKETEIVLHTETPKNISNSVVKVSGSVKELCVAAADEAFRLGYETTVLTDSLSCCADEAGRLLGDIAAKNQGSAKSLAFIAGGETVVQLKGNGLGGRNQELALSAAENLYGCRDTCVFSVGSDGTDGPTDAAGGYVDEHTLNKLKDAGISINKMLYNNDSYNALKACDGLIFTGPTGTNVNDVSVVLIKR